MICHSEFISESNDSNDLATLEIPKQVRDDNCDTVCKTAGKQDVAGRINIRIHRDVIGYWHNFIGNEAI